MSDNVDTTFIHRRRAQIFAKLNSEFGPIEAGSWLNNNVPEKERNTMFYKYLKEELKKNEPITD
jgi:hypothetical protein